MPKNCKPSLLQWLQWLASSPVASDTTSASVAADILLLLPDLSNITTVNRRPSATYISIKQQLHGVSLTQFGFEGLVHSVVDSSFSTSPSLVLLQQCMPNGKFAPFGSAYFAALSIPSELVLKSFSFLSFLLGRLGHRVNFSNAAVQEGLFPAATDSKCSWHSKLEALIKLLLFAADFEISQSPIGSALDASAHSSQIFSPKSGSTEKVSLLIEFLAFGPCLTSVVHDLASLEFMLYRPPHIDRDSLQVNFHCIGYLKDLFNLAIRQHSNGSIQVSPVVREFLNFVETTESTIADLCNWTNDIGDITGSAKFMWLVNSRLVIHFQRNVSRHLSVFSSFMSAVDAAALPSNISTLCGMFGCFFRLLALVLHWRLNVDMKEALNVCNCFVDCIVHQKELFSSVALSATPPFSFRRNCHVSETSLFFESVRAVVHALSLLCISGSIRTHDVVPALLNLVNAFEAAGAVALSDTVLATLAKVGAKVVGIPTEISTRQQHTTPSSVATVHQSNPSEEQLLKTQRITVAMCAGAPFVSARCSVVFSLLLYLQSRCPRLPAGDRTSVAIVCAHAIRCLPNDSDPSSLSKFQGLRVWKAAADLALSIIDLRCGSDEIDEASHAPIVGVLTVVVQAVVQLLSSPLADARYSADIYAHCCDAGIKLLRSAAIFASEMAHSNLVAPVSSACFNLLESACTVDISHVHSRDDISANASHFTRSRWAGITNIGNTCYAASVLQQLVSIPCFVAALSHASPGPLFGTSYQPLLPLLQSFSMEMAGTSGSRLSVFQPNGLYSRCIIGGSSVLDIADTTAQSQDAAEFFVTLINHLNVETATLAASDAMASSPRLFALSLPVISSSIAELFAVGITETFDWPACGCTRSQIDESLVLTSEGLVTQDAGGKSFTNINAVLDAHFSTTNMQRCCACGGEQATQCISTKRLTRVSDVLLLQLRCDTADGACVKIFEQPSFPLLLDVVKFAPQMDDTEYHLQGVILHHGLSMSTGHYTAVVRDAAGGDRMWGRHFNDARTAEPVLHSAIREIASREGRCVDLENGNLLYSGKPYILVYVKRQQQRAQPVRAIVSGMGLITLGCSAYDFVTHFSENIFDICKIAATRFQVVERTDSGCLKRQVVQFCIHVAPACVRLGQGSLRQLQCLFPDAVESGGHQLLDYAVSVLLSAATAADSADLLRSMLPFYLMTRAPSRRAELQSACLPQPAALLSLQDCSPSRLGPAYFAALVSAAHSPPVELDHTCLPLVEILKTIARKIGGHDSVSPDRSGSGSRSSPVYPGAPSTSPPFVFPLLQYARIQPVAAAVATALIQFTRITEPPALGDGNAAWLAGLAERDRVECVCQCLERSGAVALLVDAVQANGGEVGGKRSRDESGDGVLGVTVWQQLALAIKNSPE